MKKPIILIIASLILIGFLAFTGEETHTHNDDQIKTYDAKIDKIKTEINELNKSGSQRAAVLDSLLSTI